MIYYNDNDPNSAAWLRELISRGLIADGVVDDRSILDVQPDDLRGFTQCHFFAGIGAWSFALRLAGWPDDRPVWTGSPPCQPFSVAGLGLAVDDPRHLSPKFASLVRSCRPDVLFGEQVASAQVFGGAAKSSRKRAAGPPAWAWLDDLCDRLEAAHYAVGASDIPSAGVGAPHIRQRTFFGAIRLADGLGAGLEGHGGYGDDRDQSGRVGAHATGSASSGGAVGRLANAEHDDRRADLAGRGSEERAADGRSGAALLLDDRGRPGPTNGFWRDADWLFCRDDKWRPVVASYVEMADGPSARMGRSRSDFLGNEEVETRLQAMRDTFDEEEIQRQAGRQWCFQEEGVLRSLLHGGLDGGADQEHDSAEQQTPICENCGVDVRSLSSAGHKVPCASCGRESSEQRPLELEDIVHLLSPSLSLAELWGRREDAKRLRLLQRRLDEEGSMLHPPLAGKEAWASLSQDAKDRVGLDFDVGAWRRVVSFPLVDGNAFKQGSGHLFEGKSRAAMLRGYGNAINPWAAKVFIEGFCEAAGIPLVPDYLDALGLNFTY